MISTTLGAIAAAEPALERLGSRPLPIKVAYTTSKLLRLVRDELKTYQTLHDELVKKHGVEEPAGSGNYRVEPNTPAFQTFRRELVELLETKVEIPWSPLALETLGDAPFRADDLVALDPFIVDGQPATPAPPALAPKP